MICWMAFGTWLLSWSWQWVFQTTSICECCFCQATLRGSRPMNRQLRVWIIWWQTPWYYEQSANALYIHQAHQNSLWEALSPTLANWLVRLIIHDYSKFIFHQLAIHFTIPFAVRIPAPHGTRTRLMLGINEQSVFLFSFCSTIAY